MTNYNSLCRMEEYYQNKYKPLGEKLKGSTDSLASKIAECAMVLDRKLKYSGSGKIFNDGEMVRVRGEESRCTSEKMQSFLTEEKAIPVVKNLSMEQLQDWIRKNQKELEKFDKGVYVFIFKIRGQYYFNSIGKTETFSRRIKELILNPFQFQSVNDFKIQADYKIFKDEVDKNLTFDLYFIEYEEIKNE